MVGLEPQSFREIDADGGAVDRGDSSVEHVGAFLREARETTGQSLADVAIYLRIRTQFLQSIEDGRYEDLPGPTYTVGFIRSYADYLGLDTASLLAQFKTESNGAESHPDLEFPVPPTVGWFPTGKVVASCAVLAAAVFAGWFYLQTENLVDVAAVPLPPGLKSAIGGETAKEQPAGTNGATTVVGAVVPTVLATSADNEAVASAPTAEPETAVPGTTAGETSANGEGQPYQLPVPLTSLVAADPVATEADLRPAEPSVADREDVPPPTTVAAAPAEVIEPPAAVETKPTPAATNTVEPSPSAETEPAPVSANDGEPPLLGENLPEPAAASVAKPPPPAVEAQVVQPRPPVFAAPEPAIQVAALPSIPVAGVEADTNQDGRTYGVINQQARVVIGAKADSWVQVLDGNQNVVLTRMLRAGDRYLVPNRNDLVMLTGNAGGLIISVDGEPVPRIGSDGAILHNVRLDVDLLKAGRAVIQ